MTSAELKAELLNARVREIPVERACACVEHTNLREVTKALDDLVSYCDEEGSFGENGYRILERAHLALERARQ